MANRRAACTTLFLLLFTGACASAPPPEPERPAPVAVAASSFRGVPISPLEVKIQPRRQGGALEVAIAVVARGHAEGESFEDPNAWDIEVRDHKGTSLRRIMNGPARVVRDPVGVEDGSQWDVTVKHSVFFACPEDVPEVAVRVAVPQARPVEIRSELR